MTKFVATFCSQYFSPLYLICFSLIFSLIVPNSFLTSILRVSRAILFFLKVCLGVAVDHGEFV